MCPIKRDRFWIVSISSQNEKKTIEFIQREESVTKVKKDSELQDWSYLSSKKMLCEGEGEGEEDTDFFDRFNAENISLKEYLGAIKHQTGFNTSFMTWVDLLNLLCILHKFCELVL